MKWATATFLISVTLTIGALVGYTQYLRYLLVLNHILPITGFEH